MANQPTEFPPTAYNVGGDNQDALFAALSNTRRRAVLQCLRTADTPVSVADVVTELVAWEDDQSNGTEPATDRSTLEVSLLHVHLPKLADAGLVEYDAAEQNVVFADGTSELQSHLETMAAH